MFAIRTRDRNRVDQDLGMLQIVDERLSIWGWETGTGTKFAVVVDTWGKAGRPSTGFGVKGEDLRPVSIICMIPRGVRTSGLTGAAL